ncbi:unnamed protein product, partial [Closterium sp. NIES-54]
MVLAHMWRDCFKLPDGWTPAQGQEGRGAGGGRGRGRGGHGGREGGAASMKNGDNESESRDDRFPGQFFFVSMQAPAAPEKDESFEESAAVGKVTLHSLDYWVINSGITYSMTPRADLLTKLESSLVNHVTSALGQRAEVKGMGKALFKGAVGKMVGLKNVLWVPNLAANLTSVRWLQKAGMDTVRCKFTFHDILPSVCTSMHVRMHLGVNGIEGVPVQPVLDKMRDLYAKLATAGITYPEQTKCLKMLSLLPESWLQFTSRLSLPQNQSLWTLEWVRTNLLEEDFRRRQLRGGDDGSSGYGMQGSKRGGGHGFGGAGHGANKDDDSNDQQGGTGWGRGAKSGRGGKSGAGGKMKGSCWYCEKEGHPWFLCYKKPDGWTPRIVTRMAARGGTRKTARSWSPIRPTTTRRATAGEQGDASAKVGAELHPLDYWVLDTGAAWTMTLRKELLDDVRAAPINEVCSASGHALKVAGAGRAAFKGADGKPVVLHDALLVPDLKANLISLRKLAKAGVSTSTDGARTYKGQLGNRVLWDLHESKKVYRSMWQLPALVWHGGGQAGEGSASQGECNAVGGVGVKVSARSGETDWATAHRRLGHVAMPLLKQIEMDGAVK